MEGVLLFLFLFVTLLLLHSAGAHSVLRHPSVWGESLLLNSNNGSLGPQVFFEVAKPIPVIPPCASVLLLNATTFASTFNSPAVSASYNPPPTSKACPSWRSAVLTWEGRSEGRQFDRISAVWISGVEVFRTCTAEPTKRGIVWKVSKDISRYAALLSRPQVVVVELANIVTDVYTGVFNITLTIDFYTNGGDDYDGIGDENAKSSENGNGNEKSNRSEQHKYSKPADLILPISALPAMATRGYWFPLTTSSENASVSITMPRNIFRAVLELCLSFHGDDEFWYTNPPDSYLKSVNASGIPGGGPFREVQASLDGNLLGSVWPVPIIYTGGVNPLLWRPAAAIGAFDLPTYDIDLTPFVGLLVDGYPHTFTLHVKNIRGDWFVDANLHLWLDRNSHITYGSLLTTPVKVPFFTPVLTTTSDSHGLDGTFHTRARMSLYSSGFLITSWGKIVATTNSHFNYENTLVYQNQSNTQLATLLTRTNRQVSMTSSSTVLLAQNTSDSFPFYLLCTQINGVNGSLTQYCNLTHSLKQKTVIDTPSQHSYVSLQNGQSGQGILTIVGKNITGVGSLQQKYALQSTEGCYSRSLSTYNYSILHDFSTTKCPSS